MATLAQINDTLRDQTSSIEDGTRTTAGLRDRFGEFLDRQQGSGDKREQEIEERQKERRQRVMAQRPRGFSAGLQQGLGFGGGLNFGGIAQSILGAMGLAAGAIGLGAGRLLKFSPAIVALSDFGEKAIRGMVDYIDEEIEGVDFKEETKKRLTQGGQAAIAAKLLGAKGLFGPAIAGVIGAYGETGIQKFNEAFGNKDGTYNIPLTDIEIDTETEAFKDALAITAALIAPSLIKIAGKLAFKALKKVPLAGAAGAVSVALASMFGLKSSTGGIPPDPDEIKNNKKPTPKTKTVTVKPLAASSMMQFNSPPGSQKITPANINAMIGKSSGDPRVNIKPNPNKPGRVPFKFPQLEKAIENLKTSGDGLSKSVGKMLVVPAILYEYFSGLKNEELSDVPNVLKGTTNLLAEGTAGTFDFAANIANSIANMGIMGGNFVANQMGMEGTDLRFNTNIDTSGAVKRAINSYFAGTLATPSLNDAGMSPNIGLLPPGGLSAEGYTMGAGEKIETYNFRGGDANTTSQTIIQNVGTVVSPADHFLIQLND